MYDPHRIYSENTSSGFIVDGNEGARTFSTKKRGLKLFQENEMTIFQRKNDGAKTFFGAQNLPFPLI